MDNTDSKSIEVVCKIKKYLSTGMMKPEAFPKVDVLDMISEQYMYWINETVVSLQEYLMNYTKIIDQLVAEDDQTGLSEVLEEIIQDMRKVQKLQKMLVKRRDKNVDYFKELWVGKYKQYAKSVYNHYHYQSTSAKRAFRGKGCVYTVITGQYDELRDPLYIDPAFDYICFTNDNTLNSDVWNIQYINVGEQDLDNVRLARKYKILCYKYLKGYDYSVYVDGKIHIIGDLNKYIDEYSMGSSMLCFPHFTRDCVYEEAKTCISLSKDKAEIIEKQMDGYKREGYPLKHGLIDSACLVRRHDDRILQQVMDCWWKEIKEKSRRDQLSIGYACWKNNFYYDICDLFIYDNEFICKKRDRELPY